MSFAAPEAFLLLVLPFLIRALRPPSDRGVDAIYLPPALATRVARERSVHQQAINWAPFLIWVLVVTALAGPRRLETLDIIAASGRDIVLSIDLSGSMEKEDFTLDGQVVSRLAAVKDVASRFVEGRVGDRVGVVVFGDKAYVAAPLTHDVAAVARVINELTIGISGRSTAISDGLGLAMKRLRRDDASTRVVILLSDGRDTTGAIAPAEAAELASGLDIRVHTIALGPDKASDTVDERDLVDAPTLAVVAEASGGEMFKVRSTEELQDVAAAVDTLEPTVSSAPPIRAFRALWIWPAGAAVIVGLFLLAAWASPRRSSQAARARTAQ